MKKIKKEEFKAYREFKRFAHKKSEEFIQKRREENGDYISPKKRRTKPDFINGEKPHILAEIPTKATDIQVQIESAVSNQQISTEIIAETPVVELKAFEEVSDEIPSLEPQVSAETTSVVTGEESPREESITEQAQVEI